MVTVEKLQSAAHAAAFMTSLRAIQAGQVTQADLTASIRTINAGQSPVSGTVVSSSIARALKDAAKFAPIRRTSRSDGLDGFFDSIFNSVKTVTHELATTGAVTTTSLTIPKTDTLVTRVMEDVRGVPMDQIVPVHHFPAPTTVQDFLSPRTDSPPPVIIRADYSAYGLTPEKEAMLRTLLTPEKEAILRVGYGLSPSDPLPKAIVEQLITYVSGVPPGSTPPPGTDQVSAADVAEASPPKWLLYGVYAVGAIILFTSFKDYKKAGRSPFVRGKARIRRRRRLPLR